MSGNDSESGATRRGFGFILGGLAAGAILGTTVVANADDTAEPGSAPPARPQRDASRPDPGVVPISHRDIESLASKLDALTLSGNERALLVGILSVAVDTIGRSGTGRSASPLVSTARGAGNPIGVVASGRLPSIRQQFRSAFIPGVVDEPEVDKMMKQIDPPKVK